MTPLDAAELLNREFLGSARILQVAASLDRIGRAPGAVTGDARLEKLSRALAVLQSSDADRAEQIQLIFSRPYEATWPEDFGLKAGAIAARKTDGRGTNNGISKK